MKEIKNVKLPDLVKEAAEELITEKRRMAAGLIKQQLQSIEQLTKDLDKIEKEKMKKKIRLDQANEKMEKLRKGDWSVLQTKEEEYPNNTYDSKGNWVMMEEKE